MAQVDYAHDYETYREIMNDLLKPIASEGLDADTLKRLYESKLVYLENLRIKCFQEMNGRGSRPGYFSTKDYELILRAVKQTHQHLHDLIIVAVTCSLECRQVI